MKLKTFAGRAAAAGAVLAALVLAALPVWAAPRVQVDKKNAVADHADILSAETENYINDISISLSDACGAQIGHPRADDIGLRQHRAHRTHAAGLGHRTRQRDRACACHRRQQHRPLQPEARAECLAALTGCGRHA